MTRAEISLIKSDLPEKWQQLLSDLITDPKELLQILELDADKHPCSKTGLLQFPFKVPRTFAALMEKGNWNDPLLRQVWPFAAEAEQVTGFIADPLGEAQCNPVSGLLHKYQGRVLLTTVPHCAVHCRYCFRRHFDYAANSPSRAEWQEVLDYIIADDSIEEVILSGGDPLAASDRQLRWLIQQLGQISHLTTLRIHSRFPIVIPQRITPDLTQLLRESSLRVVMVLHCNHARELSQELATRLRTLTTNGVTLMNQTVLLREINDNSTILVALSKALGALNIQPYYLHLPDKVAGTSHYAVSKESALLLMEEMQRQLPGYLVPKLVQEEYGANAKVRLA